ncbi:MAG: hypothetical protein FWF20_06565 [Betaproteobacteria bacterium]|nr:hypothetical protein [Betaproteobacteria bacterium]MCL2886431.1 hypothetical protein [Betaproteobacteria bacterium]
MTKKTDDQNKNLHADKADASEEGIPAWLADLVDQNSLLINGDDAKKIGPHLWKLGQLRKLKISYVYRSLPELPSALPRLKNLEELIIEEGGSTEILPLLCELSQLRKLQLAYLDDDLKELPESLARLTYLEELNVDGADFVTFPAVIGSLTSLQSFSYQYCENALSEVFDVLSVLLRLKKLRLSHSSYDEKDFLPESFCRLQAIEELHFNDWNTLQELPECIGNMRTLRVIDISNDDHQLGYSAAIKELPDSLCNLSNLEELDVYGLQDLKKLPADFSRLSRLKRLGIMGSGIEELQLTTEQWKNLEELRMHGPLPDLRLCTNLRKFSWFKNDVGADADGVPYGTDEVISLPLHPLRNLEWLSIHGGALDDTAFLASMTNLRNLSLSCDFESFPEGFEKLDELEEIRIWGAKSLTAPPEYIGRLPSLKRLRLIACAVKSLPKSVQERSDLEIFAEYCPFHPGLARR